MTNPSGTPVRVEIVRVLERGECPLGLKVGDTWVVDGGRNPEGMCSHAWGSIETFVFALRCGGTFPWNGEREIEVCCPDAANPVVFRVTAG